MCSDEIWDEDRWEAFLRENDQRLNYYIEIYHSFLANNPAPERDDLEGRRLWKDKLRAFFQARGAHPENGLINFFVLDEEQESSENGDIWMTDLPDEFFDRERDDESNEFLRIPVFRSAFRLSGEVLDWANGLPSSIKNSTLVHFCSCVTQIGANVAKGHVIGYEHDSIGGNIAYAKRGLQVANMGLMLLHEMRREPYMDTSNYLRLYERTFEVRNQLALYILDLREKYNLGID